MTTCDRCGSARLFQFEANQAASKGTVRSFSLPLVCRDCGQMTVGGVRLEVPEAFELHAKDLAAAAAQAGSAALDALTNEDEGAGKVSRYFSRVYRNGYLDGFLRCMAFSRHNSREGKIKRLRELWKGVAKNSKPNPMIASSGAAFATFDPEAFEEFDRLLTMGSVTD